MLVVALVALLGGGVGSFFLVQNLLRHGLPTDIPLPDNATFVRMTQRSTDTEWVYTVEPTTMDKMLAFYEKELPAQGWVNTYDGAIIGNFADLGVHKDSPPELLEITIDTDNPSMYGVPTPSGGVVLDLVLSRF